MEFQISIVMVRMVLVVALALSACSNSRITWDPPEKYDKPYDGILYMFQVEQPVVVDLCKQLFKNRLRVFSNQKGCAWQEAGTCIVVTIDRMFEGVRPEDVVRHEIGHCNGWGADHADR